MWVASRYVYDDEVEPLHNPNWVATAKVEEQKHLDSLKAIMKIVAELIVAG